MINSSRDDVPRGRASNDVGRHQDSKSSTEAKMQYYQPKMRLSCLLTVLNAISQFPNAEFKCLLSKGIKGTPVIQDSIILFCHVKNYHLGPIG